MLRMFLVVILVTMACSAPGGDVTDRAAEPPEPESAVVLGERLVLATGCHDCHTPMKMGPAGPEPDASRALSGHPQEIVLPAPPDLGNSGWAWLGSATNTAFAGPWGVSYATNLTPDASGLAAWDEETFIRALRTGRHWGTSRPILPPMPWQAYRHLTDEELSAIFAYLHSLDPIENHVPEAVLTPPMAAAPQRPGDAAATPDPAT